jgi:hypothetical protein
MRLVSTTFYGLAVFSMLALPSFGQGYYGQQAGYNQPGGNPGYYYGPTPGAFAGYGTPPNPYPARGAQGYGYGPMPAGYGRQGPGTAYAQAPMPYGQGTATYAPAPMPYGQGSAQSGYGYARGDDGYVQSPATPRGARGEIAARAAQPTPGRMPVAAPQSDIDRNAPPSPTPPYPSVESISPGGSSGEASASDKGSSQKSDASSSDASSSKDLWRDECNSCDSCENTCCRCSDLFTHQSGIFADFLYLRAFGVDMAHGIQENVSQSGLSTAPAGEVGTLKPEFEPAFRVGFERACCGGCSGIRAAYTQYESNTSDVLFAAPGIGGTASSLVLAPGTVVAGTTFAELDATYGIDFRLADVEYSIMILDAPKGAINWDIGARYGHLTQDFSQLALFAQPLGDRFTSTNITFDGGGLRTGLDGAWECGCSRITLYGKGFVNFLFGEFSSSYSQVNITTTDVQATSHWVDSRVVPVIETEFGVSWTSCRGCLRLSAGYESSYWFNVIDTAEFIQAVQNRVFTNASQTIAFTGVVGRVEARW